MIIVYGVVLFLGVDWRIALVIILTSIFAILIPRMIGKSLTDARSTYQEQMAEYVTEITDLLEGFRVINQMTGGKIIDKHEHVLNETAEKRYQYEKKKSMVLGVSELTTKFVKIFTFAVVIRVEMRNSNPYIILSRTSPVFLERLFENEVPEIFDGLITIKNVVRVPGERAKVAVESYDDRIDPVGACVGMKGSRIHGIVRELRNENIDVINYTNNLQLYITRALNPAKIKNIEIDEAHKKANVYLDPEEVSLAIGKGGLNIKLASQLTGYDIDVYRELDQAQEEDVNLDEFADEIEGWVIDELKRVGCDTAKSVLELSESELESRTDLEIETIREVLNILKAEFE